MTLRDVLNREISEKDFTQQIVDLCRLERVPCYHTYDARRSREGFPDLVIATDAVIFAELKAEAGSVSEAQDRWLTALDLSTPSVQVFVWRPHHWPWIERIVRNGVYSLPVPMPLEEIGAWPHGEEARNRAKGAKDA